MLQQIIDAARATSHVFGWIGAVIGYLGAELVIFIVGLLLIVLPASTMRIDWDQYGHSGAERLRRYKDIAWCIFLAVVGALMIIGASTAFWHTVMSLLH